MKMSGSVKCIICLNKDDFERGKCNDSWKTFGGHGSLVNVLEKLFGVRRITREIASWPSLARILSLCRDCWNIFSTLSTLLILIRETQLKIDEHLKTVEERVINSHGLSPMSEETTGEDLWDNIRQDILHHFDKGNEGCEQEQGIGIITNVASIDIFQPEDLDEIKAEPQDNETHDGYESGFNYDVYENVEAVSFTSVKRESDAKSTAGPIDSFGGKCLTYTKRPTRRRRKRYVGTKRKKSALVSNKGQQKSKLSLSMWRTSAKSNPNMTKPKSEGYEDIRSEELTVSEKKRSHININKTLEISLLKQWNLLQSPQPRIVLVDVYKNIKISPKRPPLSKRKRVSTFKSSPFISLMHSDSEDESLLIKKFKREKDQDEDFQPILVDADRQASSSSDSDCSDSSLLKNEVSPKHQRQNAASKARRKASSVSPKQTNIKKRRQKNPMSTRKTTWKYEQLDPNDEYLSKLILKRGIKYYNGMPVINIDGYHSCVFEGCYFRTEIDDLDHLSSLRTLVRHFRNEHKDDKNHRCTACDVVFKSLPELKKHHKLEHPGFPTILKVQCNVCGKPLSKKALYHHQWFHMNEEEREAAIASEKSNPQLRSASSKKKPDITFLCTLCGKTFPDKGCLTAHGVVHKTKAERQKYICETCGEVYTTRSGFNLHMKREHNPDLLLAKWKYCKICDKRFLMRTKLDNHMRSAHGAERIHQCTLCKRKFSCQVYLKKHAIVHKPDHRPHYCTYCDVKPYRQPSSLNRHMRARHPDKPVIFTESYMSKLKKPIFRDPTPVMTCKQMYPCLFPKCEKIFELPSRLKKHCKISHPSYEQPLHSSTHLEMQLQEREHSPSESNANLNYKTTSTVNLQEVGISTHVEPPSSGSDFDQTIKPNGEEIDRAVQYLVLSESSNGHGLLL